jgi:hypothetical protein
LIASTNINIENLCVMHFSFGRIHNMHLSCGVVRE